MFSTIIKNARVLDGTGSPEFTADIGITGITITAVDRTCSLDDAVEIIDARGLLVTPGFVDIHTHYDGQICWDKQVTPSCWHGVTTVVMGNCGVGFAPVAPGTEGELISLMESVEDIPGTALHDGIPWGWESFAEYLDAIDTPYTLDIGTQAPHVAIRHYVMGDRCYEDATREDMEKMRDVTREALEAGALGFSTSRFYGHLDKAGNVVPGTEASAEEMYTIGEAFQGLEHGTIEIISDHLEDDDELAWIEQIIRTTKRPVTVLTTPHFLKIWPMAENLAKENLSLRPQVGARPASILMTLESTINPMRQHMAYREIQNEPLAGRQAALKDPEFRRRILSEEPRQPRNRDAVRFMNNYEEIYVMDDSLSYEPSKEDSIAWRAITAGVSPLEIMLDVMAEGTPLLVFFGGYSNNLEAQRELIENPHSVFGLSDGGAHCGVLVDASVPTYMLSYFARDRERGPTIPLPLVVHKMTQDTARTYGLLDRGVVAEGYRADLNIIDFEALKLHPPEMVYDLPGDGKRLIQRSGGYRYTMCAGEVTYQDGRHTGAMPGRLIRGG